MWAPRQTPFGVVNFASVNTGTFDAVSIKQTGAFDLTALTANALTVTASGNITQSRRSSITGATTLKADTNTITVDLKTNGTNNELNSVDLQKVGTGLLSTVSVTDKDTQRTGSRSAARARPRRTRT